MYTKDLVIVRGTGVSRLRWPVLASFGCHLALAGFAAISVIEVPTSDVFQLEFRSQDLESPELDTMPHFEVQPPEVGIETQVEVADVVIPSINLPLAVASLGGSQGLLAPESQVSKMMQAVGLSVSGAGRDSGETERGTGNGRGGLGAYQPFNAVLDNLKQGLELVIVFDSTGSMEAEINIMKLSFMQLGSRLLHALPNTRIAFVSYKDTTDAPVVGYSPLTNDLYQVHAFLSQVHANGGGQDIPEAVEMGLWQAVEGYTFRKAAVKVVLLFGDAPPRQDGLEKAMMLARKFSLQPNSFVSTVSVRSMQPIPEFFHIAAAGGGESMILGNGNILPELLLLIFRQAHREEAVRLLNLQR